MSKELSKEKTGLPVGWEMKTLGEVCEIFNGSTPLKGKKEFWDNGEINWFTINDIRKQGRNIKYTQQKITSEGFNSTSITLLPKKSVLLCCTASVGEFAITDVELTTNQQFNGLVVKEKNKLFSEYLFHYSSTLKDILLRKSGKATIDFVSMTKVKTIPIPLPPLPQQKQIVATLDKAFAAIDTAKANVEKNLQNAKELFENTLQILFDNKNWVHKKLGEIASFKNGMNFTKSSKGQSIEIVGVKNFKNKFWVPFGELEKVILDGEMSEGYQLKKGDIITVRSNGNPKLIGRTLLADEVNGNVSHSGFTIRIRLNSNTLLPVFLCHYLKTSKTIKELVDSGNGVGIKSLNQGSLSSLMIPYPKSEEEQKLIVNKIEGISKQTKKLEAIYTQKLADLEELKKSVLQKAFSGQLSEP